MQSFVKPCGSLLIAAFFGAAVFNTLPAGAGEPPMAAMNMSDPSSQTTGMNDMTDAPGLAPFGIMTGEAGHWMVGYQFMLEQMDGNLNGTDDISSAEILKNFSHPLP